MPFTVTLERIEPLTETVSSFYFAPPAPVTYIAGQFTKVAVPHDQPDDRGIRRWYTLASSPTEDLLMITTRFAREHSSTFKVALRHLQPGAELRMVEPAGDFVLPPDPATPILFIAGGMGVTPIRSMVKWLTDKGQQRPIQLIHAVNNKADLLFADIFTAYDMAYMPVIKEADFLWKGETGMLGADRIEHLAGGLGGKLIYISGPEAMLQTLVGGLLARGVSRDSIITDFFPGYLTL